MHSVGESLSMSVGVKAICLEVATLCLMFCGVIFFTSQQSIAETLLISGVVCGLWSMTLRCPRCGRNIRFKPLKWFHDFPMYDRSPLYDFRHVSASCPRLFVTSDEETCAHIG
jgi:hypothetical protein